MFTKVESFLKPELIFSDLDTSDKYELLETLVKKTCSFFSDIPEDAVLRAILEREHTQTTAVKAGFAFPHCRSAVIDNMIISIGISKTGVEFGSPDDKPVHFIFLLIIPEKKSDDYLFFLSQIARVISHDDLSQKLLRSDSAYEIFEELCSYIKTASSKLSS